MEKWGKAAVGTAETGTEDWDRKKEKALVFPMYIYFEICSHILSLWNPKCKKPSNTAAEIAVGTPKARHISRMKSELVVESETLLPSLS